MTNEEWLKTLTTEELASVLESFSACSRCRHRGNDCFPSEIDIWLTSEHVDFDKKENK